MDAGAQEGRDLLEGQESPLLTVYGIHIGTGIALATPAPACGSRWSWCWNPGASDSWSLCIIWSPAYPLPPNTHTAGHSLGMLIRLLTASRPQVQEIDRGEEGKGIVANQSPGVVMAA